MSATSARPAPRARRVSWIGWTIVALLLAAGWLLQQAAGTRGNERGFVERLLGPVATLTASAEWIRADIALRAGDYPLAYARAETALELEPSRADAWIFLAHHLIYERASLARAVDPAERRVWVKAGLDILDRGIRASRDPADIHFYRAGVFVALALLADSDRPWTGSASEAWLEAADSFDRAEQAGRAGASEFAAAARLHASASAGDRAPPFREVPRSR